MKSKWFLDSGCSRHMTWDRMLLSNFKVKDSVHVTLGDNEKRKIIGIENIDNHYSRSIENVLLVDNYVINVIILNSILLNSLLRTLHPNMRCL